MRGILALVFLSAATGPVVAYFGLGAPRLEATVEKVKREVKRAEKFPSLHIKQAYGIENEYQLNLGKAIDTLRRDYPHAMRAAPDFSVFTDDIQLTGVNRVGLDGLQRYKRVFDVLRFLRNTTMVHDEVGARLVVSDGKIRVRWNAKLTMNAPFGALPGLARDEAGRPLVYVDGVSVYEVNSKGNIFKHELQDIVVTPPSMQGAVDLALVGWPGAFSPVAVPAVAPYFQPATGLDVALADVTLAAVDGPNLAGGEAVVLLEASGVQGSLGLTMTKRRAPVPVATARETPMERAAREQVEDAERAERLTALRSAAVPPAKKGLFSSLLSSAPQTCESNDDCERPLVCCDLVVASICCSSGMMIGPPQASALQRQAIPIPIPVPVDAGGPHGGYPRAGGDAGFL